MKFQTLLKRVYREDDVARTNWSTILCRVPLERPVLVEYPGGREPFEREYLMEVLKPLGNYAVDRTVVNQDEDGTKRQDEIR